MSIARALTKRIKASESHDSSTSSAASSNSHPGSSSTAPAPAPITRSASAAARRIDRAQISLPVTLISTTNVLAYEAPDIYPTGGVHAAASPAASLASTNPLSPAFALPFKNPLMSPAASAHSPLSPLPAVSEAALSDASSTRSSAGDGTDASTTGSASTAPSSVVSSPVISREASPGVATPALPELNHLSAYFPQHKARPGAKSEPKPPMPAPKMQHQPPPPPATQVPKLSSPSKTHPRKPSLDTAVRAATAAAIQPSSPFASGHSRTATPLSPDAPAVPARTRAHTVQTHQALARQRSLRSSAGTGTSTSTAGPPPSADSVPGLSSSARTSGASSPTQATAPRSSAEATFAGHLAVGAALDLSDSPLPTPEPQQQLPASSSPPSKPRAAGPPPAAMSPRAWEREPHPFGAELAQVRELAEEIGVRIWDEEEAFLAEHGLRKFGAADYIGEIGPLFKGVFDGELEEETTWL